MKNIPFLAIVSLSIQLVCGLNLHAANADQNPTGQSQESPTVAVKHEAAAWHDPSPRTVQFVTVDQDVRLEVLDWGGTGRPLVLLAGLGNTAHVFDNFAPKLTGKYHVYGITRRGFGASSSPATGYTADRMGDDVLAVLDTLKIERPILAGHSIAGEELSSIGTRHPERVAGLIYLDAVGLYSYYDSKVGNYYIDLSDLQKELVQLQAEREPDKQQIQDLLQNDLPRFERDLQIMQELKDISPPNPKSGPTAAILAGQQKYTKLHLPILALCALPHATPPGLDDDARAKYEAMDKAVSEPLENDFEKAVPSARVVRFPLANHYIFMSNEADVLREMNAFIGSLPQ
jgi:non-heme chloroperoxidase